MNCFDVDARLAEAEGQPLLGQPQTLRSILSDTATRNPTNRAVVSCHQTPQLLPVPTLPSPGDSGKLVWTYKQLIEAADRLAASLYSHGVRKNMRVVVFLYNSAEWVLLFWACAKLGATFVPLDARGVTRVEGVSHFLTVTKPAVLVVNDSAAATTLQRSHGTLLHDILLKLTVDSDGATPFGWACLAHILPLEGSTTDLSAIESIEIDAHEDTALIIFTSGTSGRPKACPYSGKTLWAACMAANVIRPREHTDSLVQHLPCSHIFACWDMLSFWSAGATVIFPSKIFDPKATLDAIEMEQCTHMSAVPSLAIALMSHPVFAPQRTKSLRFVLFGGTVISPDIVAAATDKARLGADVAMVGFGMSEGLPTLGTTTDVAFKSEDGCLGLNKIPPGTRVKICGPKSRKPLRRGETGELHVGGNLLIQGYLIGDSRAFYDDLQVHWLATGDQAKMDDEGRVYILGRYKDIIIRGGENLSPALIETCLNKAGLVAQVIGLPDEVADEVPIAVVQMPKPGPLPLELMHQLVSSELGVANLPTAYLPLEDLGMTSFPMTVSGKIRKDELKQAVLKHFFDKERANEEARSGNTDGLEIQQGLVRILASLLGQSEDTVPLDRPVHEYLDSINILRLQVQVKRELHRDVAMHDILQATSIRQLSQRLGICQAPRLELQGSGDNDRNGPPSLNDMVHTHGDASRATRTRDLAVSALQKIGMRWDDVEDVVPLPIHQAELFEAPGKLAWTVRISFVARHATATKMHEAVESALVRWNTFRSIAVKFDATPLLVTLRASAKWYKTAITPVAELETPQDLCALAFSDNVKNSVSAKDGNPLVRFAIANIKSTGTAGVMILMNHIAFDAISWLPFRQELELLLDGKAVTEPKVPYKMFADMHYQYSTSLNAQLAVSFHTNRLRGIGILRDRCWPPQRSPGWIIGDEEDRSLSGSGLPGISPERKEIDSGGQRAGLVGITQYARLEHLSELNALHRISTPVVFKAACALLNSQMSGSSDVLFTNTQAGRQWPFMDDAIVRHLPNPISIAGNTLTLAVNRIHINPRASVGAFLEDLETEQRHLTTHAHAPSEHIAAQLNPADAAAYRSARRQLLNWGPHTLGTGAREAQAALQTVQLEAHGDTMLEWHCGMWDAQTARLVVQWDGCQAGTAEVEGWTTGFMKALRWLGDPGNWGKEVGRFEW